MTTGASTLESERDTEVVAFRMKLRPGCAAEYRRRHDAIWPELTSALRDAGVCDYRIFHDPETDILFALMRRTKANGLVKLRESELNRKWWAMMSDIMETRANLAPVESNLTPMFILP